MPYILDYVHNVLQVWSELWKAKWKPMDKAQSYPAIWKSIS